MRFGRLPQPWILGFWAVSFFALPSPVRSDTAPKAEWSAEQVKVKLLEWQQSIRSIYVEYQSAPGTFDNLPDYPRGTYVHRILAMKYPFAYYLMGAHGYDGLDWKDDPLLKRCYLPGHGTSGYAEHALNRAYFQTSIRPDAELPDTLPNEFVQLATGLWPLKRPPPRFERRPIVLREVATCPEYKVVRPQQELVNGHWCHVLEYPGYERLWIDTTRGFILLARETVAGAHQALMQRMELGEHRELEPGLWLPTRIRNIQYDSLAETPEGRSRKLTDSLTEILEVKVNQVEDEMFEFRPPPGALRFAASRSEFPVQTQPGGLDHLDNLVHWIQKYHPRRPPPPPSSSQYLMGLPALAVILCCEGWRRWRRRLASRSLGN